MIKKYFLVCTGWIFKSVGLLSYKDYEYFKINISTLLNKNVEVVE